jgi:hypothetical protein
MAGKLKTYTDEEIQKVEWLLNNLARNQSTPERTRQIRDGLSVIRYLKRMKAARFVRAEVTIDGLPALGRLGPLTKKELKRIHMAKR